MQLIGRMFLSSAAALFLAGGAMAEERIVFVRHGEKPPQGLGQLDCKGLNRALALPAVFAKAFGKPNAIFAPDPAKQTTDFGVLYDYVRPLATIEPTAIALGMPINTQFGLDDTTDLIKDLEKEAYHDALIIVAWEHKVIVDVTRQILSANGGEPDDVPKWNRDDFDSIYVVTIDWSGPRPKATFQHKAEGLDGQPDVCPR
jgi:hypothetical protein